MADGAHHSCWLLLHALFRIARVPTINSAIAVRTINKGLSIATSTTNPRGLQQNYRSSNEPTVNTRLQPKEQMLRTLRTAQWLRHASWFSVPPSSYAAKLLPAALLHDKGSTNVLD